MTNEEAIKWIKQIQIVGYEERLLNHKEALDMAIKALEQEPILDKIRSEIKEVQTYKMFEGEDTVYVERKDVLAIIDKCKAEKE